MRAACGGRYMQYFAAISASLSVAMQGAFLGWPAPTLPKLEAADSPVPITLEQASWLASINSLTTLIAVPLVALTIDRLGRKWLLLLAAAPFAVFWLMVAFVSSFEMLLAARIIGSIGSGIALSVPHLYVSEVAQTHIRGALAALFMIMMNSGNLYIMCTGPFLSVTGASYAGLVLPALFVLTFVWVPESPYFLLLRKKEGDAKDTLARLRANTDLEAELREMHKAIQQKRQTQGSFRDIVFNAVHRRTLLLVVGLTVLYLGTGSQALVAFSTEIFNRSGSSIDSDVSSIIVAAVQLVASVSASALVDRAGRRPLLICGFVGCAVSMAALGVYFFLADAQHMDMSALYWLPLTGLTAFQASYALGLGAAFFVVVGEIFHVSVKGVASSVVTAALGVVGFATKMSFQPVSAALGTHWVFWGFAVISLCGALYVFLLIPETKGQTFSEINELMESSVPTEVVNEKTKGHHTTP
ncbi:facilitated trehalose transporter Tret1-like [Schistocerca piceifrons]|uniref:facilitated trehalose transporter Tret1-like n=1 Tax=Schistocerca piceifrons TaxID=274613 RepID=UPI001F5ED250|nr:facilitated trehalose transporter Tret1-like [Schistocerca piceifrons]